MAVRKKTSSKAPSNAEMLEHATDLLGKIWDYWRMDLGHSENAAGKKMKLLLKTLHQSETKKKTKPSKSAKLAKKATAASRRKKKSA
jgi:hypothetical protein